MRRTGASGTRFDTGRVQYLLATMLHVKAPPSEAAKECDL
jgi:hypothetical protein